MKVIADRSIDVLFVVPPGGVIPGHAEHLGLAFLRTMLHRAGIRALQYLPPRNPSAAGFARDLAELRPAAVGFTVYESNRSSCRALAAAARSALPGVAILAGGPCATFSPEETMEHLGADACLRGAGEGAIVPAVEAILGARGDLARALEGIPSLVLRTEDGPRATPVGNLSSFPAGAFATLDDVPSPYLAGLVDTPEVGYLTARGCNQNCTYCSFAAISGRRVHAHGIERVLADLEALRSVVARAPRRPKSVPIGDDAFTLAPHRAEAICEGIVARGLQMPFDCETRADRVDAGLLRLMRRAGFVGVAFGLESAVPHVLRAAGKLQPPDTESDPGFEREREFVEAVRRAVREARAAGLNAVVSIIAGLPGERPEDLRATLEFVRELEVPAYAHNVLSVLPGTPLHADRRRHGLDAGRDRVTGRWSTAHAHDVAAIESLPNSSLHAERRAEAERLADALCGRPRKADADERAPWAAVIHAGSPDGATLAWLAGLLAVPASLVVVAPGRVDEEAREAWERAVVRAGIPLRHLSVLERTDLPDGGMRLRVRANPASHEVDVQAAWDPGAGGPRADGAGNFRLPMWIGSGAVAAPAAPDGRAGFAVPQIADGCRWWSGWRRCRQPRVLHVGGDGVVRPCWNGPPIGRVGDPYAGILARGMSLGTGTAVDWAKDGCPMGASGPGATVAETLDLASQLAWLGRGVST